ncbi:MAG: hypothetical protein JNJ88_06230 [Planctomycetes bacterium]|nr:hypothetical protein [Planctomycetota bacterium]
MPAPRGPNPRRALNQLVLKPVELQEPEWALNHPWLGFELELYGWFLAVI